jgi:hypothetical protein
MTLDELEAEHAAKEAARLTQKALPPARYPTIGFTGGRQFIGYMCESHHCSACRVPECRCECHDLEWMGMC